jgi:hypothetical protein
MDQTQVLHIVFVTGETPDAWNTPSHKLYNCIT